MSREWDLTESRVTAVAVAGDKADHKSAATLLASLRQSVGATSASVVDRSGHPLVSDSDVAAASPAIDLAQLAMFLRWLRSCPTDPPEAPDIEACVRRESRGGVIAVQLNAQRWLVLVFGPLRWTFPLGATFHYVQQMLGPLNAVLSGEAHGVLPTDGGSFAS